MKYNFKRVLAAVVLSVMTGIIAFAEVRSKSITLDNDVTVRGGNRPRKKAISQKPALAIAHYNLGSAYLRMGRYEEALKVSEEAVRLFPDEALGGCARKPQLTKLEILSLATGTQQ